MVGGSSKGRMECQDGLHLGLKEQKNTFRDEEEGTMVQYRNYNVCERKNPGITQLEEERKTVQMTTV